MIIKLANQRAKILGLLIDYFGDDDKRIAHAREVLREADILLKNYKNCDEEIVIAVALLHDVGIKVSEEKHGYNSGETQEIYGPAVAEGLLASINFPKDKIEVVKNIISNHHSPSRYDYPELSLLKATDHIVNSKG
ncbi:MAG: HD domain-containing protein [Fidelibacterota bacterium]